MIELTVILYFDSLEQAKEQGHPDAVMVQEDVYPLLGAYKTLSFKCAHYEVKDNDGSYMSLSGEV